MVSTLALFQGFVDGTWLDKCGFVLECWPQRGSAAQKGGWRAMGYAVKDGVFLYLRLGGIWAGAICLEPFIIMGAFDEPRVGNRGKRR